ncbi:SUMF1/EgtB/PvdO family nonheme iron enzyme [Leptolyngbya sp. BC1307]|uniref:SUMF1/EgtB/PvdO family nonheme iron enzyme n=1 Tax=Leptolyngbya sp. BC1307 TaxID=2029589 RepID=UPI000EFB9733|nr:SUMF1/EgtB/PvdO family nonheme iron enzyme [Leptolyngbya sp. BC1307]
MSKNWAICIGINEYKYVGRLKYARADAQEMRDFCQDELGFDEVFYFAEGAPDVELPSGQSVEASPRFGNLDRFLDIQFRQRDFLNPQDSLWFFFAGHGIRADGIDYLIPIDGNDSRIEQTGLQIQYIAERLRRCGAGNIVLMLDACRDGDARDVGRRIGEDPQQGVVTICSCGPNEQAYEIASLNQGVFTYALLEGLRQEGARNCATVDRLENWLKHRVKELNAEYDKPNQTPIVRAEPANKVHLVLIPDKATVHDAAPLREDAMMAELNGDLKLARQLWINVLAIVRADLKAIQALERIAVKRAGVSQTAQTLGIGGERASSSAVVDAVTETVTPVVPAFSFEVVTVDRKGAIAKKETQQAEYRLEELGQGVELEMVAIPGGQFHMGAADGEGSDRERPQHWVRVEPFWMGKYPVMQAQWRAVAALPQVDCKLYAHPSKLKGNSRPVERVSWRDAVEFCKRLSQHTGQNYRLPSEAEWEYACRAETMTPFHFGETLTSALANYNASNTYRRSESASEYRKRIMNVGSFPANAFGLCDMHGTVREWCADHWHENYRGAPTDGSVWLSAEEDASRCVRGGSGVKGSRYCRSAYRFDHSPDHRDYFIGFRVSCVVPRALA